MTKYHKSVVYVGGDSVKSDQTCMINESLKLWKVRFDENLNRVTGPKERIKHWKLFMVLHNSKTLFVSECLHNATKFKYNRNSSS